MHLGGKRNNIPDGAERVGGFEICPGQMIDDVRLGVLGRAPVTFIGGISMVTETLGEVHIMGELKVDGLSRTTEELHAESVWKAAGVEQALGCGGIDDHHD